MVGNLRRALQWGTLAEIISSFQLMLGHMGTCIKCFDNQYTPEERTDPTCLYDERDPKLVQQGGADLGLPANMTVGKSLCCRTA